MLRNKIFALLFVLFFIPQSLYATVHPVSHNEAVISLSHLAIYGRGRMTLLGIFLDLG
jgi:hypothetical protein